MTGGSADWRGRRVLVTGAGGFIGLRLTRRLAEAGAQVGVGIAPDEPPGRTARLPEQVERQVFDLRDGMAVRDAVVRAEPQVVFHLAAVGVTDPEIDPALALAVNAGGTVHLLEALKGGGVQRVVLVGTCYEYGAREAMEGLDPFSAYAASKVAAWAFGRMYWRAHRLPVVVVRPFQVYGPGQPAHTLVSAAIGAALAGEDLPLTPGEQERDFVFVEDVVQGMLRAATAPGIEGESVDLGTGQPCSCRRVVELVWRMTDARGQMFVGALPYRAGEVMRIVADAERTARLTGWRAQTALEEGLRETIHAFSKGEADL